MSETEGDFLARVTLARVMQEPLSDADFGRLLAIARDPEAADAVDRLTADLETADETISRLNSGKELQDLMALNNRLTADNARLKEEVDAVQRVKGAMVRALQADNARLTGEVERLRAAAKLKSDAEEKCLEAVAHVGRYNSGDRVAEAKGWVMNAFADIDEDEQDRLDIKEQ